MRTDNELLQAAKISVGHQMVSINRINDWRERYRATMGEYPEALPATEVKRAKWRLFIMRRDMRTLTAQERHGNAHIVKMPKHRRQYVGSTPGGRAA